ncbi:MAG: terminase small subunit [Synergistaceae bacterium]|nr:terminase small subunit [Synergistaceae bacterium]
MTGKQNVFVQEYLKDLNATQAAIRAGYSQKTAYSIGQRLLSNVEISQAIDAAMSERSERAKLTADYVLQNLHEIAQRCMQKSPVMVKGEQAIDDEGRHLWTFDAKNALRALELIGKHMGMFSDKNRQQEETPEDVKIQIAIRRAILSMEAEQHMQVQQQS